MEKFYVLSETQLKLLLRYKAELNALEYGGVDNWDWYGESIHESEDWDSERDEWNVEKYLKEYKEL